MDSLIELCFRIVFNSIEIDPEISGPEIFRDSVDDSLKATIPQSFSEFKHCIPCTEVDIENDEFTLKTTGSDSVSGIIRRGQLIRFWLLKSGFRSVWLVLVSMMNKLCLTAREAAMSKDSGLMMNSTVIVHIIFCQKSKVYTAIGHGCPYETDETLHESCHADLCCKFLHVELWI